MNKSEENENTRLINEEKANDGEAQVYKRPPGYGTRHTLAILGFIGFFNVYALRANLSIAMVAMVKTSKNQSNESTSAVCPDPGKGINATDKSNLDGEFEWDETTQGIILGAFFYGYVVTQIPGGRMAEAFGAKKLLGFGILTTSVLTLVTPLAARLGVWALIGTRVIEGLGEGVTIPAMHAMLGKWAPRQEISILANVIYGGAIVGYILVMPLAGLLSQSSFLGGWPSAFYIFGALGCVWFMFWMIMIYDTPADHPRISEAERLYISGSLETKKNLPVPIRSILKSNAVWAIAASHFTQSWGGYTMMTCLPMYMNKIQRYDITQDGFIMSIMYFASWASAMISGFLADVIRNKHCLSTATTRKIMNTIGMLAGAVTLLFMKQVGCDHTILVILLIASTGVSGTTQSGYAVNHIDISPNFAGTLMGITNMLANISGILAPYTVGVLTNNNQTFEQWQIVFYISAGMYAFGAVYFLLFAKGETQSWNNPEE